MSIINVVDFDFSKPFSLDDLKEALEEFRDVAGSDDESETHAEQVAKLEQFISDVEDYCDGSEIIPDEYFKEYAEGLAEELHGQSSMRQWPFNCINWDEAASVLQADYTEIDYDGMVFWVR